MKEGWSWWVPQWEEVRQILGRGFACSWGWESYALPLIVLSDLKCKPTPCWIAADRSSMQRGRVGPGRLFTTVIGFWLWSTATGAGH